MRKKYCFHYVTGSIALDLNNNNNNNKMLWNIFIFLLWCSDLPWPGIKQIFHSQVSPKPEMIYYACISLHHTEIVSECRKYKYVSYLFLLPPIQRLPAGSFSIHLG